MKTARRPTLRRTLPLAVLLVLLGLLMLNHLEGVRQGRAAMLAQAREDIVVIAEKLARSAQRDFRNEPLKVASDFSGAATDLRVDRLVLVDADGIVRGAWAGDADPVPELTRQIKELQSR